MVSRKAKLAVEKVFFNTETNLPRPKIPVINLPNLEKILQNPDTELKAQIQNQMREEQLKQAIEEAAERRYGLRDTKTNVIQRNCFRAGVEYTLFKSSNFLRHASPEIMKQAGWVREEEWSELRNKLETRIAELNAADLEFCKDRWERKDIHHLQKQMAREESYKVAFARQELQSILLSLPQPPKQ